MAIGLGLLRLSSKDFWTMTPIEFERAVRSISRPRGIAPVRADLAGLMRDFPDTIKMEAGLG